MLVLGENRQYVMIGDDIKVKVVRSDQATVCDQCS